MRPPRLARQAVISFSKKVSSATVRRFKPQRAVQVRSPIFVIGCGRSGTTLLFDLLKRHPALAPTTGQPDGEDHVGWIEHGGALIAGLANPSAGDVGHVGYEFCLHMNEDDVTDQIRASMHRYYGAEVLEGRESIRVVNKCPHLANKLRYVRSIFPDARFLHIVREPVAMVASWVKVMQAVPGLALYWPDSAYPCLWVFRTHGTSVGSAPFQREDRLFPGGGLLRLADYWAEVNGNIPRQLEDTRDQLLSLRYEDLVAQPQRMLRNITEFCGLEPFADVPVPIQPERNKAYRSLLTGEQVQAIIARCRPVAAAFGYGSEGGGP
jgi:Sulfotransferase family